MYDPTTMTTTFLKRTSMSQVHKFSLATVEAEPKAKPTTFYGIVLRFLRKQKDSVPKAEGSHKRTPLATACVLVTGSVDESDEQPKKARPRRTPIGIE